MVFSENWCPLFGIMLSLANIWVSRRRLGLLGSAYKERGTCSHAAEAEGSARTA